MAKHTTAQTPSRLAFQCKEAEHKNNFLDNRSKLKNRYNLFTGAMNPKSSSLSEKS
jgi:hypothetical protein